MTADECDEFRRQFGWEDAVRLRRWDDEGKQQGEPSATVDEFKRVLETGAR